MSDSFISEELDDMDELDDERGNKDLMQALERAAGTTSNNNTLNNDS